MFKFTFKKSNIVESFYKFFSYHKWLGIVFLDENALHCEQLNVHVRDPHSFPVFGLEAQQCDDGQDQTLKVSNRLYILIGIRYPVKIILCTKMAGSLRGPVVYIISSLNELSSAVKKCLPNANITSIPLLQPGTVYNYRKT